MPIAMPIGIAVTQASTKAENTRNMLASEVLPQRLVVGLAGEVFVELLEHRLRRWAGTAA